MVDRYEYILYLFVHYVVLIPYILLPIYPCAYVRHAQRVYNMIWVARRSPKRILL